MVKIVVTSIRRFLHSGSATPDNHSWKCAMTALVFSCATNCRMSVDEREVLRCCVPLPETTQQGIQIQSLHLSRRLPLVRELPPYSINPISTRQETGMPFLYQSKALVELPRSAIFRIQCQFLALPSTQSSQPIVGLLGSAVRLQQQPFSISMSWKTRCF